MGKRCRGLVLVGLSVSTLCPEPEVLAPNGQTKVKFDNLDLTLAFFPMFLVLLTQSSFQIAKEK